MLSKLRVNALRWSILLSLPVVMGCPTSASRSLVLEEPRLPLTPLQQPPGRDVALHSGESYLGTAARLGLQPIHSAQQATLAVELGLAIRELYEINGAYPGSAEEVKQSGLLFTTLLTPDSTPAPFTQQFEPWTVHLSLSGGMRHLQLNRTELTQSRPVLAVPIVDRDAERPASVRLLPPTQAVFLLPDVPSGALPGPITSFPTTGWQFIERSADQRDAQIRSLSYSLRTQLSLYLESAGQLPDQWEDLQAHFGLCSVPGSGGLLQAPFADWQPAEAGLTLERTSDGDYVRMIRKASQPVTDRRIYRVQSSGSARRLSLQDVSMSSEAAAALTWNPLVVWRADT